MFLPRFSTRTMLIILAVAALLFAIVSQGLVGLSQRWDVQSGNSPDYLSRMSRLDQIGVLRQAAGAASVAVVALALLMTINAVFFFIGWLLGRGAGTPVDSSPADLGDAPANARPQQETPRKEPSQPVNAATAGVEDQP